MSLLTNPLVSGALRARALGVLLAAASLILPGVVLAQPSGPNGIPVCTANNDQVTPAIVPDGSGGSIIAWQDCRSGNYDIYAQRANADGVVLWTLDGVAICTADSNQLQPQIVDDGSGGAIIAWQDFRNCNWDIYAQRVNSSGLALWTANGVPICTAVFDQLNIAMISDGLSGAILTWEDNRSNVVDCPDIYAQRVDENGVALWTADGVSICNEASAQHGPRLTSDGSGGAFITWADDRAGNYDIYTQRIASGGAVQWTTNGVATCTMGTDQLKPDICSDDAGGVIVTWYDYRSTTDFDIYAQRQGPGGAIVWVVDGVVMNNNEGYDQINPRIVSDGVGGAIIVWQDYITGTTSDVYAQRVAAAGAVLWTATGVIICTAAGNQTNPQIVTDGNSGAFITWADYRDTANCNVYAQRIAADATINWPATGYLICDADSSQTCLALASDGNLGAVVAWQDRRNGNWDIYAQGFNTSGAQERHNVGCTEILVPTGIVDSGVIVTPVCTLYNFGTAGESYTARLKIGDAYNHTASVTGHAAGTYACVTFPDWQARPRGNLAVTCSTQLAADNNSANDRWTDSVFVAGHDVGATAILAPTGTVDSGLVAAPRATVHNFGAGPETFDITFSISDGYHQTINRTVASGADSTFSFSSWTAVTRGSYVTRCSTQLAGDMNPPNDVFSDTVNVAVRDVGATVILAPSGTVDSGTVVTPWVIVRNFGSIADSFNVRLSIGDAYCANQEANLPAGGTDTVQFEDWTAGPVAMLTTRCSTMLASDMYHGNDGCADSVRVEGPTAATEVPVALPRVFVFDNPNPNPFIGQTRVRYGLPHASHVTLRVYSLAGKLLATLRQGTEQAGYHSLVIAPHLLPRGVFYCRFQAEGFTETRKLVRLD